LTNPAGAPNQVLGVFAERWVEPLARVLGRLGSRHVLVVHSEDGLDEISISAPTHVAELRDGTVRRLTLIPEDVGLARHPLDALRVDGVQDSLTKMREALTGHAGPVRDIVAFNAGAGIYTAGLAKNLNEGVARALQAMTNGSPLRVLEQLVTFSQKA
jgi:anthranilate phosphoribosyltransferase